MTAVSAEPSFMMPLQAAAIRSDICQKRSAEHVSALLGQVDTSDRE